MMQQEKVMIIVLCGVAGSGKTTIGHRLAAELGWPFVEGDDYHPRGNIEKMQRGEPLSDADRQPWLDAFIHQLGGSAQSGQALVASCSALKRVYRDRIRAIDAEIVFVMLSADAAAIRARIAGRDGHFAGVNLVESQFATLEPLSSDEGLIIDAMAGPANVTAAIRSKLGLTPLPTSKPSISLAT